MTLADFSELYYLIQRAVDDSETLLPTTRSGQHRFGPVRREDFRPIYISLARVSAREADRFKAGFVPEHSLAKSELTRYLRSHRALGKYFHGDEHLTVVTEPIVSLSMPVAFSQFVDQIIRSAILYSVGDVTRVLWDFLDADSVPTTLVYLLAGTDVVQEIILDEYCKLVPTTAVLEMPAITDTLAENVASFSGRLACCALVLETTVHPGTWSHDDADWSNDLRPIANLLGISKDGILMLCGALSLVTMQPFIPFLSSSFTSAIVADTLPIPSRGGGFGIQNRDAPILRPERTLAELETDDLTSLIDDLAACPPET